MRVGPFEIDCVFNERFVLAEVCAGQARLLRFLRLRNARGGRADWLKLYAEIGGSRTRRKAVRELGGEDADRAAALEQGIAEALTVPSGLGPGSHAGRLVICDAQGERELPFTIEILDARVIPNDFTRARLLAAYLREDDALRAFASDRLPASAPGAELERLYDALLERQLAYQPPVATRYPDCQRISGTDYTLAHGGSCADLSLLLASLLWCRGLSPALLLFPSHMAAGVFEGDSGPAFETLDDARAMLGLVESGALTLVETTALCSYRQQSFSQSKRQIEERLREGGEPCVLVNAKRALRQGGVKLIPDAPAAPVRCANCGYDRLSREDLRSGVCPACGQSLPAPEPELKPDAEPAEVANSGVLRYGLLRGEAAALKLLDAGAQTVRVAPVWQGRAVRGIAERALERAGLERALLPDSIDFIGDYAFCNCARLARIALPEDLRAIGAGAFAGSGLKSIAVPGSVRLVSRMAFSGCAALECVDLGEGIEQIGERAFAGCPRLRAVRIPASVKRVARGAFDPGCELILASARTVVER